MTGRSVPFEARQEPWVELHLRDGTVIRVRCIVTKVLKFDEKSPDGLPAYQVQSATVWAVEPPPELPRAELPLAFKKEN